MLINKNIMYRQAGWYTRIWWDFVNKLAEIDMSQPGCIMHLVGCQEASMN